MKQRTLPPKQFVLIIVWNAYRTFIENAMQPPANSRSTTDDYISNRLFTSGILYGLPIGLISLLLCAYLESKSGDYNLVIFNTVAYLAVSVGALNRKVSLNARKYIIAVAVVIIAIVLIANQGSFSIGCSYLMVVSLFFALHFSGKPAYLMLGVNALVCISYTFVIAFHLLDIKLLYTMTLDSWIINSINFLFLNLLLIILSRQTINRLQWTMKQESEIYTEFKKELQEKLLLNNTLRQSERQYKTLFYLSPSAKLIFDEETQRFVQVNEAAVRTYGYTEDEFLRMKLSDIQAVKEKDRLFDAIPADPAEGAMPAVYTRHRRKDGQIIQVELLQGNMEFQRKPCRMIVVNDITKQVEQLNAISLQNARLREIAYTQSHEVRLPLTNIMALTSMISEDFKGHVDQQLLDYLERSTMELDNIVRKIVIHSSTVLEELGDNQTESK